MRPLWVSSSNAMSGNATRLINLSKYIDCEVIFSAPKKETGIKNVTFTKSANRAKSILEKTSFVLSKKPELIHCFKTLPTSGIPSFFGKLKGARLIVDWDDFEGFGGFADQDPFPYNHIAHHFEKWIIKRADILTVVSPFLEEKAYQYGFRGPVHFIPNGADVEGIKYSFPNNNRLKVLFVGLLYKSSDLDFVIKSFTHLNKEFRLIVVGDGPKRQEFEALAKRLNVNVCFEGMKSREEVKKYLYNSDIALMPYVDNISNRSRSPVKLGEYLAAGKPVVTSPVGIMKEIIKDRVNGIMTKDNPEDFAEGIKELSDRGLRKKISLNARKTAEKLSWKSIAKELKKVYSSALQ